MPQPSCGLQVRMRDNERARLHAAAARGPCWPRPVWDPEQTKRRSGGHGCGVLGTAGRHARSRATRGQLQRHACGAHAGAAAAAALYGIQRARESIHPAPVATCGLFVKGMTKSSGAMRSRSARRHLQGRPGRQKQPAGATARSSVVKCGATPGKHGGGSTSVPAGQLGVRPAACRPAGAAPPGGHQSAPARTNTRTRSS